MTQPEAEAQKILDAQGFIVINSWDRYEIEDLINNLLGSRGPLGSTVVVTGKATLEEWVRQHRRFFPLLTPPTDRPFYYKVIAE